MCMRLRIANSVTSVVLVNCEMNQNMVNWAQNQLKNYHWSHECKDTEFIALVSLEIVFLY